MSLHRAQSENSPKSTARPSWPIVVATVLAAVFFLAGLGNEPFADEYAYLTQAYFTDLVLAGKTNDPAWLEYPAYDLPPLPKYLIGLSLHAARIPLLDRGAAFRWYEPGGINRKFGSPGALTVARVPSALLGALGCAAVYAVGCMVRDRLVGWAAFFLLMVNPLYGLLARRAMSDVPCEALIVGSLAFGLAAWLSFLRGRWTSILPWSSIALAGVVAGLALLCKFSGLLALMTLGAWAGLAVALRVRRPMPAVAFAAGSAGAAALTLATFTALNPFMTARPDRPLPEPFESLARMNVRERFRYQMKHRATISEGQQRQFSHNALLSPLEKVKVVAVQGFGRFGPFGKQGWSSAEKTSERRYEWAQDWGALIWGPLVLLGFIASVLWGWRQRRSGEVPTGWTAATWAIVAFGVITAYIPMAWDRYLLPVQSVSCLLVAILISLACGGLTGRLRPTAADAETGVSEA